MTVSTLGVLYAAKARLENPRTKFVFTDWTSCTCGHIYAAAHGRKASSQSAVANGRNRIYVEHIMAVARALGWRDQGRATCWGKSPEAYAAAYISNVTSHDADEASNHVARKDAIKVIDTAIHAIEAQQEQDRLDVLAQTRTIIDNAVVGVEPQKVTA